jgi:hypothetical protein
MKPDADIIERLDDKLISGIADALYSKLVGVDFDVIDHDLRLRLALEQRLTGGGSVPFGLDRLNTTDAAAYLGLQPETLRANAKRKALDLPIPYIYGKNCIGDGANLTLGSSSGGGAPRQQPRALRAAPRLQPIPPQVTGSSADARGRKTCPLDRHRHI